MTKSEHRGVLTDTELLSKIKDYNFITDIKVITRFFPYLDYVIKNGGLIDHYKITSEEMTLLGELEDKKLILTKENETKTKVVHIDYDFYIFVAKCLFNSYVCV